MANSGLLVANSVLPGSPRAQGAMRVVAAPTEVTCRKSIGSSVGVTISRTSSRIPVSAV